MIVAPLSRTDYLFLLSVLLCACSLVVPRGGGRRGSVGWVLAVAGWSVFGLLWVVWAGQFLAKSRFFLGGIALCAGVLSAYAVRLSATDTEPAVRATAMVVVMGVVFSSYQYLVPVRRTLLEYLAVQTAGFVNALGYDVLVTTSAAGFQTKLVFPATNAFYTFTSTCSGIGAIAFFLALVVGVDPPRHQAVAGALLVPVTVVVLNLVRTTFVAVALAAGWFSDGVWLLAPASGATASYAIAETILGQTFVVVASGISYLVLATLVTEIDDFTHALVDRLHTDYRHVAESMTT